MSSAVHVNTFSAPWRRARVTNATDASFPAKVPTATKPAQAGTSAAQASTQSIIDWEAAGQVPNVVRAMFYGVGSDTNTFSARFYGWAALREDPANGFAVWVPFLLCELLVTLCSTLVIATAGGILGTTQLFADTITLTYGNDDVSVDIVSPANDLPAHVVVDMKGAQLLETTFTTGSSATSCNALLSTY